MPQVILRPARGTLTNHGKRLVADSMYHKGKGFVAAAVLLSHHEGHEYVVLHLLGQGIENILKGLLLFKDYDQHRGRLKGKLGHDLVAIATEATAAFDLNPLRPPLDQQLRRFNALYSRHLLRYGSFRDILVDARTIPSDLIFRRTAALVRLAERERASLPGA